MKELKKKVKANGVDHEVPTFEAWHPSTGNPVVVNYGADLAIREHDLQRDLRELPAKMAWYAALKNKAAEVAAAAKEEEERAYDDLYIQIKPQLEAQADKGKVTETEVKTVIRVNPKMRRATDERLEAEAVSKKLGSVVDLMIEKRWALMSIVKLKAAEMGSGLGDA